MNALAKTFGDKLSILAFPSNQFGHQTNESNSEILSVLKHVRPGNGFEPHKNVTIMEKIEINGPGADPIFAWLKESMPIPDDELNGESIINNGTTQQPILWAPIARSDVAWNFEKFLIDGAGQPIKRYSRYYDTASISTDIEALLK